MEELWQAFVRAVELIVSLDSEVVDASLRSLTIAATSCSITALLSFPLASLIHFSHFRGKRLLINVIQTFYSIPTVAVGLFVFVLFSQAGPLGGLNLMFTPAVMVIGQVLLVTPIMLGLTISALSGVDKAISETAISLGASQFQVAIITLKHARFAVLTALIIAFSRAVSEIGLALMVGGNIRGFTRTLTTAISLETAKGDIEFALALGLVLIFMALVINLALSRFQKR